MAETQRAWQVEGAQGLGQGLNLGTCEQGRPHGAVGAAEQQARSTPVSSGPPPARLPLLRCLKKAGVRTALGQL